MSSEKYRSYFDLKLQSRHFVAGEEVILLLPDSRKKLLLAWKGPFTILKRKNKVNYIIDKNRTAKLYHINLLTM